MLAPDDRSWREPPVEPARDRRPTAVTLAALYASLVAVFIFYVSWTTVRDHFARPYGDDWRFLDELFAEQLGRWYLAPKNGHRMPLTLLLFELDYRLGAHMHLLVGATLGCVWLTAGAVASTWGRHGFRHPAFGFVVFALFWAAAYFALPWGTNQGATMAIMWLAVALAALAHAERVRARTNAGATGAFVASGLAAIAATFSFGTGIATFAALVVVSVLGRLPARVGAAYTAVGLVTAGAYAVGLEHVQGGTYLKLGPDPLRLLGVAVSFVGGAVGTTAGALAGLDVDGRWRVSVAAGAAGLAVGLGHAALVLRRGGPLGGAELLGFGLMTFSAVTGCLVALGRSAFWDVGINSRFIAPSTLFWMGLVAAMSSARPRFLPAVLLLLVSLAMLPAYREGRIEQARIREILDLTSVLHLLDLRADAETRGTLVKKSPGQVYRVVDRLRHDRRAMFAETRAALAGTPLATHFRVDPAATCGGTARVTRLVTRGRHGVRLGGHANDPAAPPASIVVTDPDGIIRGLGVFTPLMHARYAASAPPADGVPYRGFIADWDATKRYQVWAVRADGHTVCRIAMTVTGAPVS